MIFLDYLGKMGQLGNQMFQYASLRGIAKHKGYDFGIPNHDELIVDFLGNRLRIELYVPFNLPHLKNKGVTSSGQVVQERFFEFDQQLFEQLPDNVSIAGYFQTEKYFAHIRNEILEDFSFKDYIVDECKEALELCSGSLALHIRRGDFLRNSGNHHNLSLDWYAKALQEFDEDRQVVIFSDDPQWCKEQDLFESDRFLVCETDSPYHDLYLMSQCEDFIIANSTFSWWGAWLCQNDNKKVVAPSTWFGPNNQHHNIKDLFPETWIVL